MRVPSPSVYPTANVESARGGGDRRATDRRIMTADRAVRTSGQESDAPPATDVYLPLQAGGAGGGGDADARGGPSAPAGGRAAGSPGREATRAFAPHRRQGGHWEAWRSATPPCSSIAAGRGSRPRNYSETRWAGPTRRASSRRRSVCRRTRAGPGRARRRPGACTCSRRDMSHPRAARRGCFECSNRRTDGLLMPSVAR